MGSSRTNPQYRFERFYPVERIPLIVAMTMAMIHGPYKQLENPGGPWAFRTRGTLFSPAHQWELDMSSAEGGTVVILTGTAETESSKASSDRRAEEVAVGLFRRLGEGAGVLDLGDVR